MASVDELWLVDFGDPYPSEPSGVRPALIVGPRAAFGRGLPFSIVAPLTTAYRHLSLHVEIEATPENGLHHTSYAQCELIRSININRLVQRLGAIPIGTSLEIRRVIRTLLGY